MAVTKLVGCTAPGSWWQFSRKLCEELLEVTKFTDSFLAGENSFEQSVCKLVHHWPRPSSKVTNIIAMATLNDCLITVHSGQL